jgi:hypothetical protein
MKIKLLVVILAITFKNVIADEVSSQTISELNKDISIMMNTSVDNNNYLVNISTPSSIISNGKIEYQMLDASTRKVVLSIPSSYQFDGSMSPDFVLQNAKAAEYCSSKDGFKIAIDEANYRFRGKVFIVVFDKSKKPSLIQITKDEVSPLVSGVLKSYRVRIDKGWSDNNTLSLSMGAIVQRPDGKTDSTTEYFNMHFGKDNVARIEAK